MKAGILNRSITIQKRVAGRDAAGQPVDTWVDYATAWANFASRTGMGTIRDMQGDLSASIAPCSIRIRYRTDVDAGMRAVYGTQVFDIKGVLPDYAGHEYTDLVCEIGNV